MKVRSGTRVNVMHRALLLVLRYIPPHEFEPVETVIEGVVSCQSALTILLVRGGHFSSAVVHRSHLVQPLPVNDKRVILMEER